MINLFYTKNPFNNIFINMSSGCRPSEPPPRVFYKIAFAKVTPYLILLDLNQVNRMQEHG